MTHIGIGKAMLDKHYRSIIENAMCGIALVDAKFNFVYVNKKFCNILEYSSSELLGKSFEEFTIPGDLVADKEMALALQSGEIDSYRMVKSYLTKSGGVVQVLLTVSAYSKDDGTFEIYLSQIQENESTELSTVLKKLQATIDQQDETISKLANALDVHTQMIQGISSFLKKHWWKIALVLLMALGIITGSNIDGLLMLFTGGK